MEQSTTANPVRSTRDGPFAWVSKAAMRRIQDRFAESDRVPVANSVYLALALIASDMQTENFTVKISLIASRAGVSYKTALGYLRELETAGVVGIRRSKVEGTKLDAPSTYILLPVCRDDTALCSTVIAVCNGGFNPSLSERIEEPEKKPLKKTRTQPSASKLKEKYSSELVQSIFDVYPKRRGTKPTTSEAREIRKALATLSTFEPNPGASLLERVKGYAYRMRREPTRFIKVLLNYFRDEIFYDDDPQSSNKL